MSRVLLFYQPTEGGVGRHVQDLVEGLTERGHKVVLCGPSTPAGLAELPTGASYQRLELERAINPGADLAACKSLAEIVKRTRPDVIHAHSSKAGAVARVGRFLQPNTPVIYTPHGYAFAGFFTSELARRSYREIERALAPLTSRTVCVCEAEAKLARPLGFANRVRIVYNGIENTDDSGAIDPTMQALKGSGPVLCALTQLRPGKGIETLIDATPTLLEQHPDLKIAIWGDGPELKPLRSRATDRNVSNAVLFLGQHSNPLAALREADVMVHPSLAESFPYAIIEAMSVGAAVVASDVGGIGEALVDGQSGLLVAPADPESLASAIGRLLDDQGLRKRLGEAAKRRVQERFSRQTMIDRLTEVYSELLS